MWFVFLLIGLIIVIAAMQLKEESQAWLQRWIALVGGGLIAGGIVSMVITFGIKW